MGVNFVVTERSQFNILRIEMGDVQLPLCRPRQTMRGDFLIRLLLPLLLSTTLQSSAQIQRLLGIDVSAWQGNLSQTTWNNLKSIDNRQFVIIRSSRGGTTGYYDQNDSDNSNGRNTLSQRYDDPYFIQNINRATTAGMYAGSYHFSRPDIIESTLNSGGIRNSGTDEANHFIQMAGPWMRPGYLVPVHDLEAGDGIRTDADMTQFCIDFSGRIYNAMGIRPAIYINGNYAAYVIGGASQALRDSMAKPAAQVPSVVSPAYPILWSARWANQTDPNSIDVQNGEPKDSYTAIYGPWDDYGTVHPWHFWQYASTARLPSYSTTKNIDVDVVRGGFEFLKDLMVPAVWTHNSSGDWSTLTNWNSGLAPVQPVPGAGQVTPVATGPLPTPRLPGAAGSGVTSGQNDTVILERPSANIIVTVSTGTHNVRKLYMRESLHITGGSLTINYIPSADSTSISAQFSGPVTLAGTAALQVHTSRVEPTGTFSLSGGAFTFNKVNLAADAVSPARMLINGDVALNPLANANALIASEGSGGIANIDLAGGVRALSVGNGSSDVDLAVSVPLLNGGLTKAGAGTLLLHTGSTYAGGTVVTAGRMIVNNSAGSGTGSGSVVVNASAVIGGNGRISGPLVINAGGTLAPGIAGPISTLTISTPPVLNGTNIHRIDRNGGSPLADRLSLLAGTLTYAGTLEVRNTGTTLAGGEHFTLYSAPGYGGTFASAKLPVLDSGLNWDLGNLGANGTIRVNRKPMVNGITATNTPGSVLMIPIATLLNTAFDADGDTLLFAGVDSTSTNGVPLSADGQFIYYQNDRNPADRFGFSISDGAGGTVAAVVQVVPGVVYAPEIIRHPVSVTNAAGTDASFHATVTGTLPMSYQWQFNGTNIALANASTYTRTTISGADAGDYLVICTNIAGSATSHVAKLTVLQAEPAVISTGVMLSDKRFQLHVIAVPGSYAVDGTTNLVHWDELGTLTTVTNDFNFTDSETNLQYRGYRIRTVSP